MITQEQYERWYDFAIRMARTCFPRKRNPTPAEIEENVEYFFQCLDTEALPCIVDWDHTVPYPDGSPRAGLDFWGRPKEPLPVTDMCKEHEEGWNPHYWEDRTEAQQDRDYEQFVSPVVCCIRAGIDVVTHSVGVLGFTAGDLRRMYPKPEGVPDWITGGPRHPWFKGFDGAENSTFAEMVDAAEIGL